MNDKPTDATRDNELGPGGNDFRGAPPFDVRFTSIVPSRAPAAEPIVELEINGHRRRVSTDIRATLLDLLRDKIGLTGAKKGCDHGQCGACTVLMNGRTVLSCLTLAVAADGADIVTIEGIAGTDTLHPMQQAFIEQDAFQCGYCTPGQILAAMGCVAEGHAKEEAEIREYMSGVLCRCGAYQNIVAAIVQCAREDGR